MSYYLRNRTMVTGEDKLQRDRPRITSGMWRLSKIDGEFTFTMSISPKQLKSMLKSPPKITASPWLWRSHQNGMKTTTPTRNSTIRCSLDELRCAVARARDWMAYLWRNFSAQRRRRVARRSGGRGTREDIRFDLELWLACGPSRPCS